jgi:hypothetical protein
MTSTGVGFEYLPELVDTNNRMETHTIIAMYQLPTLPELKVRVGSDLDDRFRPFPLTSVV